MNTDYLNYWLNEKSILEIKEREFYLTSIILSESLKNKLKKEEISKKRILQKIRKIVDKETKQLATEIMELRINSVYS